MYTSLGTRAAAHASITLRVPATFTSCMSARFAVLAAAGAAVAQWKTTSQPAHAPDTGTPDALASRGRNVMAMQACSARCAKGGPQHASEVMLHGRDNAMRTCDGRLHLLRLAQVTHDARHVRNIGVADVEDGDLILAAGQQLLHQVLAQEASPARHQALPSPSHAAPPCRHHSLTFSLLCLCC